MQTHHSQINVLESEGINKIFERGELGHLGCYANGEIYIIPITYVFADGYIYSHSQLGKKIQMMRKHPDICIQVEEVQNFFHWRSAIAWGRFEELKGEKAVGGMRLILNKIVKNVAQGPISELEVDVEAMLETAVIYRMKIERATGRFESFD